MGKIDDMGMWRKYVNPEHRRGISAEIRNGTTGKIAQWTYVMKPGVNLFISVRRMQLA
jgi:hypothetical protein